MGSIFRDVADEDLPDGPVDRRARLWAGLFCCVFDVDTDEDVDAEGATAD